MKPYPTVYRQVKGATEYGSCRKVWEVSMRWIVKDFYGTKVKHINARRMTKSLTPTISL
jgi:hypothetical protein